VVLLGKTTAEAIRTAVINKRALVVAISGRRAVQRPMEEGCEAKFNAIQDVYLSPDVRCPAK